MSVAETIRNKLTTAISQSQLEVIDGLHLHAGCIGARPEGKTHFKVIVVSTVFEGESRVSAQRRVNKILAHESAITVHALSISASSPYSGNLEDRTIALIT